MIFCTRYGFCKAMRINKAIEWRLWHLARHSFMHILGWLIVLQMLWFTYYVYYLWLKLWYSSSFGFWGMVMCQKWVQNRNIKFKTKIEKGKIFQTPQRKCKAVNLNDICLLNLYRKHNTHAVLMTYQIPTVWFQWLKFTTILLRILVNSCS